MSAKALFFTGMMLVAFSCLAQDHGGFTAFGALPLKTPDSLLQRLAQAGNTGEKMAAAEPLIAFHAAHGTTDSVIFYARQLIGGLPDGRLPASQAAYRIKLYHTLARAYHDQGLHEEALRYYLESIRFAEEAGNTAAVNDNKLGMANVYYARNEYGKAIEAYNSLLAASRDEQLQHVIYKQLSAIYLDRKDLAQAQAYGEKALAFFRRSNQLKNELQTQLTLGIVAELHRQTDSAYNIYYHIKNKAEQHQYFDLYIQAGQRMGDLLIAEKDYNNATALLSMVYANAIQWNDLKAQLKVLNSLRNLHAATGDYKNAYALMTQYMGVAREVQDKQNKREINELEIKYQTAQKEKEILNKENELNHQKTVKYSLLIGFLVVLLPVVGLLYMYYQKLQAQSKLNATMEEMNRQKITSLLKDKELALLKASMSGQETERKRIAGELHDSIGGNLAAIKLQLSHHSQVNGLKELIRQVDDTYHQIRDLSHDLVPQKFNNTGFTELITAYLRQFDLPGKARISFQAYPPEDIDRIGTTLKVEIYKILQELVTNAQKHSQASKVEIQLTQMDGMLKLLFEDNGKGFATDATPHGFGLRNIRERLQLFDGVLSIDSFPSKGTVIDIEIPLTPALYEA